MGKRRAAKKAKPKSTKTNDLVSVVVLGDVQTDSILVDSPHHTSDGELEMPGEAGSRHRAIRISRPGGVWLLGSTIGAAGFDDDKNPMLRCHTYPALKPTASDSQTICPESLVRLAPFKKAIDSKKQDVVYRIGENIGWVEPPPWVAHNDDAIKRFFGRQLKAILRQPNYQPPQIIVISDRKHPLRTMGFRDCAVKATLKDFVAKNPSFTQADGDGVVIWHRGHPFDLENDDLWMRLNEAGAAGSDRPLADRTVVVMRNECLAKAGLRINQDSSVEQVVEDFVAHQDHPLLHQLCRCRHLVIVFGEGALCWDRERPSQIDYHYCPHSVDDMLKPELGNMTGNTFILISAIVREIAGARKRAAAAARTFQPFDGLSAGVRLGVVLSAHHYRNGFADSNVRVSADKSGPPEIEIADEHDLPYPFRRLFRNARDENTERAPGSTKLITKRPYLLATLACSKRAAQDHGLSRSSIFLDNVSTDADPYEKIVDVVIRGLDKAVTKRTEYEKHKSGKGHALWVPESELLCPYAGFGKVQTTDRQEIENYMAVYTLISNYFSATSMEKPFSIATFGTPGSGKSFSIKQIIETVDRDAARDPLEFNVAQFTNVGDLTAVFHQAHDRSMLGSTPLVIFDEFDSSFRNEPLGWLKYFLAPMQDGIFRDSGALYHVGRAIFLFAGGTKTTFEEFYTLRKDKPEFRAAKGPDFVSRLRGYMNIPTFNSEGPVDQTTLLRRAIILRSILERKTPKIVDKATEIARIDRGVIDAFLKTRSYEHGVRSMEAIVEMSKVTDRGFRKSSLLAHAQLSLHVDVEEFLGYLN